MATEQGPFGPTNRPDSAPISGNAIRAFREELRLDRDSFAGLIKTSPDTVRGWEIGASTPRGEAAMRITALADKNHYPLTLQQIFQPPPEKKKKRRKKNGLS